MIGRKINYKTLIFMLPLLMVCSGVVQPCNAAGGAVSVNKTQSQQIAVAAGKSVIIDSQTPVRRVSIAAPDIADAVVLSPRQVYLSAKIPGVTTMTLWADTDLIAAVFDVEVAPDVARLKTKIHDLFPNEKEIQVTGTHESITLSGSVSGAGCMAQVVALAKTYAPADKEGKPRLTNLLEVAGVQQVMLEVRVSEMSRSLTRRLGINFSVISASGQQIGLSMLNNLVRLPSEGFPGNPLTVSDNVSGIIRFLGDGASWTAFVDALKDNGLLKVLAEPTLITLSGKPANFLAGGEYPVPVPQSGVGTTTITIEYKPFGVGLSFTPTVMGNGKINMLVAPEVSELDFSRAVSLQGYIIPSLTTRRVSTTVELSDGQSFAIAGLIREDVRENVRKFPVLGDLPILGPLFRSTSFVKNETELVVIVTPHLVKPLDMANQTLPTDSFSEPDDFEFYVEGKMEGRDQPKRTQKLLRTMKKGGLEGDFGHIIP